MSSSIFVNAEPLTFEYTCPFSRPGVNESLYKRDWACHNNTASIAMMFFKMFCNKTQTVCYKWECTDDGHISQLSFEVTLLNPLPDMPILGSFNSAARKDNMVSKIWMNGKTII